MGGEGSGEQAGHEFRGNQWTSGSAEHVAKTRMARAKEVEPAFTSDIKEIASSTGGTPKGLEFRLKSESSVLDKIQRDSIEKKISPDAAAETITDLNRYTITYPNDEQWINNVQTAQNRLKEKGYKVYMDKQKKYFNSNSNYIGYNTVMQKGKDIVEIQFHTQESYTTKEHLHKIYETFRSPKASKVEKYTAHKKMVKIWQAVKATPVKWAALSGVVI